jgi:asparaginyl-tRNA synthetase
MATLAYIEDISQHEGREVTLRGWLHTRRSSGRIHFLIIRDGTGFIQGVMSKAAVDEETFRLADHLSQETSIVVTGTVRADARAPSGYEVDVSALEVVGASVDYPITPKEHGVDFLLDHRHLWIRSERQQAILRVRHEVIDAIRDFFNTRGFMLVDTPIFTPAAVEGTTTLFGAVSSTRWRTRRAASSTTRRTPPPSGACASARRSARKVEDQTPSDRFWMVEPESPTQRWTT